MDALYRECREELDVDVEVLYLSGVYYAAGLDSHTCVFRCNLHGEPIRLGVEHSAFRYADVDSLLPGERVRAVDALEYAGNAAVRTLDYR
jgi:8-oxo-dGTP pyrophosphatase MutT (NUDIX family)